MITDQLVNFLPPGSDLAVTNAVVYSNVIDLLGVGAGITPDQANVIIGQTVTRFGADQGIGVVVPELICGVAESFAGVGQLTVSFEGSKGNATTALPENWQIFDQSDPLTQPQLVAGAFIYRRKWPIEFPDGYNPRFLRLGFTPSSAFTAGKIAFAMVTMGPPANFAKYQGKNFTVAG